MILPVFYGTLTFFLIHAVAFLKEGMKQILFILNIHDRTKYNADSSDLHNIKGLKNRHPIIKAHYIQQGPEYCFWLYKST